MDIRGIALVGALVADFGINGVSWLIAYALQTEYFYDFMGMVSYLTLALGTLLYIGQESSEGYYVRQICVSIMVCLWTLRLGIFLTFRHIKAGGDSRFTEVKTKFLMFGFYWLLQAVWVYVCLLPVLFLNVSENSRGFIATDVVGAVLWATGFVVESIADFQKYVFKQNPQNKGKFINVGLWKYARYPNYFGEMVIWWGIFIVCTAGLEDWKFLSVVSPLFVMMLLFGVSGIPIQEKQAKDRWGQTSAYQEYRKSSNLLVPAPFKFI